MRWSGRSGSDGPDFSQVGLAGAVALTMFHVAASRRRAAATYRDLAAQRSGVERERLLGVAASFAWSADRAERFALSERRLEEPSRARGAPKDHDGSTGE
jgi:hypothetical protein